MKIGRPVKHGHHTRSDGRSKEYVAWDHMRRRCVNKSDKAYHRYGGRGITICERWLSSFENFLKDMGLAPTKKHSLDRINNNGNYTPGNCRWATKKEQENNRTNNKILTINGRSKTVAEWAEIYKIDSKAVYSRLQKGMEPELALSKPIATKHRKKLVF